MLKRRVISGLLLGAMPVVGLLLLPPAGVWLLAVFLSSLAQLEFYTLMNKSGAPVFRVVGTVCGAAMISATFCTVGPAFANMASAYRWEQAVLVASVIAIFIRQFPQKHNPKPVETIACTLLGLWYVPFLLNFVTRLAFVWDGAGRPGQVGRTGLMLILYLLVVVKCTDMGAFFVGKALGRHKLCPRISPKKTWEGFAGGVGVALLASVIFTWVVHGELGRVSLGMVDAVILGILLPLAAVAGDLFESLIKRAADAKDSSAIIPGMGGLLDVLDSVLFGAPVLYVYLRVVLSAGIESVNWIP